eukprot:743935-Pleurochrysis_carterae.AAC.1
MLRCSCVALEEDDLLLQLRKLLVHDDVGSKSSLANAGADVYVQLVSKVVRCSSAVTLASCCLRAERSAAALRAAAASKLAALGNLR